MKKCVQSTSNRVLTIAAAIGCGVIALSILPVARYEHAALFPFALFAGVCIHTLWKTFYKGTCGFFYDEEKAIFALSRQERWEFRWEELPSEKEKGKLDICYQSSTGVWNFYFLEKGKIKQLIATRRMAGYDAFIAMLKKKNAPAHEADGRIVFDKEWADQVFREVTGEPLYKKNKRDQK